MNIISSTDIFTAYSAGIKYGDGYLISNCHAAYMCFMETMCSWNRPDILKVQQLRISQRLFHLRTGEWYISQIFHRR